MTLKPPYKYAWRLRRSESSSTHVLTVVRHPQNPSMIPCSTWQLTMLPPPRLDAPIEACWIEYAIPSTIVPPRLTVKVPRGKDRMRPFSLRERKNRARQPTGAKTKANRTGPLHNSGLHKESCCECFGNRITRQITATHERHARMTAVGSRNRRNQCCGRLGVQGDAPIAR